MLVLTFEEFNNKFNIDNNAMSDSDITHSIIINIKFIGLSIKDIGKRYR